MKSGPQIGNQGSDEKGSEVAEQISSNKIRKLRSFILPHTKLRCGRELEKAEDAKLRSAEVAKITVIGRKSGRSITITVQFVYEKNRILLLPFKGKKTNWYLNLEKNPSITISVNRTKFHGDSKLFADTIQLKNVIGKFVDKYGRTNIASYYPRKDAFVEVMI